MTAGGDQTDMAAADGRLGVGLKRSDADELLSSDAKKVKLTQPSIADIVQETQYSKVLMGMPNYTCGTLLSMLCETSTV